MQPAVEGRTSHLSDEVSREGLSEGGGDSEAGAGGIEEGSSDGNKVEDKKVEEDDAAFRMIVN